MAQNTRAPERETSIGAGHTPTRAGRGPAVGPGLLDAGAAAILVTACRALCNPIRAQIARALGSGPLSVSELMRRIGRPWTVTSQHLRLLREAGLVEARRDGRVVHYRLADRRAVDVARAALEAAARAGGRG